MKTLKHKIIHLLFLLAVAASCTSQETDFGFDSAISGIVKDNNGNPLYGDMNANNVIVRMLGDNDKETIDIRVKGDGTYQNLKMFPKLHRVWVEGPIVPSDTLLVDLGSKSNAVQDFVVTPLTSPTVTSGSATGTTINVAYSITAHGSNTIIKKEVYCSTVIYPTSSIGSMTNVYSTKTVTLPALSGSVAITGLTSGTKYFIRIGTQASSSKLMNYSNQIEVTVP
jgi:hypothetical protein